MMIRIKAIRATPVNIPFTAPYRFSYGAMGSLTKTVIEIDTDQGITGLGEVADGDRASDVLRLGEALIGLDVTNLAEAERRIVPAMKYSPWANRTAGFRVFGGLEMALWDIRAKAENRPLFEILGGAHRQFVPLSEYFGFRLPGAKEAGENSPEEIADYCARMASDFGAKVFEGKLATVDFAQEIEMVSRVREAIGSAELRLDANGAWTLPTARRNLAALAEFDVACFEEPVETYGEMAALRTLGPFSISSHVVDLPAAHLLGVPDYIVTNLNELGGIKNAIEFISAAEMLDVGFRFHSGETGIATAAYLHVSAAARHVNSASQTILRWYGDDVIEGGPFSPRNGGLIVPQGPGLGVALDPEALARCHKRYLSEGAFPEVSGAARYGGKFSKV